MSGIMKASPSMSEVSEEGKVNRLLSRRVSYLAELLKPEDQGKFVKNFCKRIDEFQVQMQSFPAHKFTIEWQKWQRIMDRVSGILLMSTDHSFVSSSTGPGLEDLQLGYAKAIELQDHFKKVNIVLLGQQLTFFLLGEYEESIPKGWPSFHPAAEESQGPPREGNLPSTSRESILQLQFVVQAHPRSSHWAVEPNWSRRR